MKKLFMFTCLLLFMLSCGGCVTRSHISAPNNRGSGAATTASNQEIVTRTERIWFWQKEFWNK